MGCLDVGAEVAVFAGVPRVVRPRGHARLDRTIRGGPSRVALLGGALCPAEERTATLKTLAEPMNDLLVVAEALDSEMVAAIRDAVETCMTLAFQG
jgi:hypothetical protein